MATYKLIDITDYYQDAIEESNITTSPTYESRYKNVKTSNGTNKYIWTNNVDAINLNAIAEDVKASTYKLRNSATSSVIQYNSKNYSSGLKNDMMLAKQALQNSIDLGFGETYYEFVDNTGTVNKLTLDDLKRIEISIANNLNIIGSKIDFIKTIIDKQTNVFSLLTLDINSLSKKAVENLDIESKATQKNYSIVFVGGGSASSLVATGKDMVSLFAAYTKVNTVNKVSSSTTMKSLFSNINSMITSSNDYCVIACTYKDIQSGAENNKTVYKEYLEAIVNNCKTKSVIPLVLIVPTEADTSSSVLKDDQNNLIQDCEIEINQYCSDNNIDIIVLDKFKDSQFSSSGGGMGGMGGMGGGSSSESASTLKIKAEYFKANYTELNELGHKETARALVDYFMTNIFKIK